MPLASVELQWIESGRAWMELREPRRTLKDYGAGEAPSGEMEALGHLHTDIDVRDGIEVLSGPEAGSRWRVMTVDHPRGNSTHARLTVHNRTFEEPLPA